MAHVSKREREKARPEKRGIGSVKVAKGMAFLMRDAVGAQADTKAKPKPKR